MYLIINNKLIGVVMPLNLGSITNKIASPDYADVLESKIEYMKARQELLNYENTCEIVAKAKASSESMSFAEELLGVPVDAVNTSFEALKEKSNASWEKFEKFFDTFYAWAFGSDNNVSMEKAGRSSNGNTMSGAKVLHHSFYKPIDRSKLIVEHASDVAKKEAMARANDPKRSNDHAGPLTRVLILPFTIQQLTTIETVLTKITLKQVTKRELEQLKDTVKAARSGEKYRVEFKQLPDQNLQAWYYRVKRIITKAKTVVSMSTSENNIKYFSSLQKSMENAIDEYTEKITPRNTATNMQLAIGKAVANYVKKQK